MNDREISYANPKVGKGLMVAGVLEEIAGGCLVGAGLLGFFAQLSGNNGSEFMNICGENAKFLLGSGAGIFAVGYVTGKVGRFQHWYANKTYYR